MTKMREPMSVEDFNKLSPEGKEAEIGNMVDQLTSAVGPRFTVSLLIAGKALSKTIAGAVKAGTITLEQAHDMTEDFGRAFIDAYNVAEKVRIEAMMQRAGGLDLDGSQQ